MNAKKFKELKITQRFLSECGLDVPHELLVRLSEMILEEEKRRFDHRLERMSEEELVALDNKRLSTVKVKTPDGLLLRSKTNAQTFPLVLNYIGLERVAQLNLHIGQYPIVVVDPTQQKTKRARYQLIKPGYFVFKTSSSAQIVNALTKIDEALQLNLDIEVV